MWEWRSKPDTHVVRPSFVLIFHFIRLTPIWQDILPTHYLTIHQSAIRALAWIRAPALSGSGTSLIAEDPTVIASGGYDGVECLTDIRDPHGNVMNRTRGKSFENLWNSMLIHASITIHADVINSVTYSPYGGGPVTIDHENTVKAYSASPSMLGRGHMLLEPNGPVWVRNSTRLVLNTTQLTSATECACIGLSSPTGHRLCGWVLCHHQCA
jgi:WD40 repeat protein